MQRVRFAGPRSGVLKVGDQDFSGRVALVTGAGSGIGAATAHWLAARGVAQLVLVDLDGAALDALALDKSGPCQVTCWPGDVADEGLWARIEAATPRLDHALINAGVVEAEPIAQADFARWRRVMSVNLDGAFLGLRASLRLIRKGGNGGSVVLTSSAVGIRPVAGTGAYGVSKAAVIQLARIAAAENAEHGIRVNAIAPGKVETPLWRKTPEFERMVRDEGRAAAEAQMAAFFSGRDFATAEVIAGQIGFLLSDAAANVLGTTLASDGGYSL